MFRKIFLISAVFIFTASYSFAGMVQTFGIGAKATAQAEAVSAHSDDPFAVYYNPAGLVLSKRPVFSAGFSFYAPVDEVTDFKVVNEAGDTLNDVQDFETEESHLVLPHMGYSMPINEKLYFGIAAYVPFGLHVSWDKDPAKNPGAAYCWESHYSRAVISPTIAYKVNDKISVGFGVSLGKSVSEAGKTIHFADSTVATANAVVANQEALLAGGLVTAEDVYKANVVATMDANGFNGAKLKLDASDDINYSFNFGVMYQPIDQVSLGLTYRGRTETNFDGDSYLTLTNGTKLMGTSEMEYDHPESVQAGVRYFATKNLSIEFDMTWTRWSINEEQIEYIKIPGSTVFEDYTSAHDRDWDDTIQYKIGAEWAVLETLALRGGYTYDPTPAPDHTFDFGWPDTDRSVFNIGCGWEITEHWVLDSNVQYIVSTPSRKIKGNSNELNDAYSSVYGQDVEVYMTNKGTLWGGGLTLSYLF